MLTHCVIYQLSSSWYYNDALVSLVFINYIIGDSIATIVIIIYIINYYCTYTKMERIKLWLWLPLYIVLWKEVEQLLLKKKKMKNIPYFAPSRYLRICCRVVKGFVLYFCYFKYPRGTLTHTDVQCTCCVYNIYIYVYVQVELQRPATGRILRAAISDKTVFLCSIRVKKIAEDSVLPILCVYIKKEKSK